MALSSGSVPDSIYFWVGAIEEVLSSIPLRHFNLHFRVSIATTYSPSQSLLIFRSHSAKSYTNMKPLSMWLLLVGSLRLASVWFGFFNIWALRLAVFSQSPMTEVHGRTFGVWTLLTCTLCYLCAFNLENKPLYLATFLSFVYALGHFLTEYIIYHTMAIANLSTVCFFAGTSIVWMLLQWNSHQPQVSSKAD
ncbi:hypothetical protein F8388_014136 [Cannabis sativa]|uniref:Ergosterol biosynthetic protein 28 n=1 Tax=Cannabis sativa TaxID=3483 RepID=A0A7J6GL29_CANSA|nr:hypothetical protein F8388_014136 [Cannabis sativa]